MRLSFYLAALFAASPLPGAEKPNILYFLCDDLGYGDVGVFHQNERAAKKDRGVPFFTTPKIDTLARDGMMLTHHYCAAPVCAPSRASFLTGQTQGHAEVRDNQFDKALPDTHTVGSVLQAAGYRTAAIGKWGLQGRRPKGSTSNDWEAYPTRRGFDFFYGYIRHRDGHFHYPKEDQREVWENDKEISAGLDLCFTTDLFTARAKSWITDQSQDSKEPFFLFLAFDTPHAVLHNPPCAFPDDGLKWIGKPGEMINSAHGTKDGWMHPDYLDATWDHDQNPETAEVAWPDVQKRYANNVRRIDDCVGDLLQLLDDLGLAENTLVVFTSDNGPSQESYLKENYDPTFFEGFGHFDGIKRDTLDGGLREPTLARWPGKIPAGKVDGQASGQWDWLATFSDVAGLPAPASSDGVSLLPTLTTKGARSGGTMYVEYSQNGRTPDYPQFAENNRKRRRGQMQAMVIDGIKGLRRQIKSADDDFEIYDLAEDPSEAHDLAKEPGFEKYQTLFKARALRSRVANPSAMRPYDDVPVPPLDDKPDTKPGITSSWYPGSWPWLPEFRTLRAEDSMVMPTLSLPETLNAQPGGFGFEGYFHAAQDGEYTFQSESGGQAALFIHDCRLIAESKNADEKITTAKINLKAGWHPIRYLFKKTKELLRFDLQLTGPDDKTIPLDRVTLLSTSPSK